MVFSQYKKNAKISLAKKEVIKLYIIYSLITGTLIFVNIYIQNIIYSYINNPGIIVLMIKLLVVPIFKYAAEVFIVFALLNLTQSNRKSIKKTMIKNLLLGFIFLEIIIALLFETLKILNQYDYTTNKVMTIIVSLIIGFLSFCKFINIVNLWIGEGDSIRFSKVVLLTTKNIGDIILFEVSFVGWVSLFVGITIGLYILLSPINEILLFIALTTRCGVGLYIFPYIILSHLNFSKKLLEQAK